MSEQTQQAALDALAYQRAQLQAQEAHLAQQVAPSSPSTASLGSPVNPSTPARSSMGAAAANGSPLATSNPFATSAGPQSPTIPRKDPKRASIAAGAGFNPLEAAASGAQNTRYAPGGKVRLTDYATIANAPLPAEGNGTFNNLHLGLLVFFTPAILLRVIPFFKASWVPWWLYWILVIVIGAPVTIGYWTFMSIYGPRKNEKVNLPGKPVEEYITIHDAELKRKYHGRNKIPMQPFHDAYFDGKIDIKGDMLDLLEHRLDWSHMHFTPELFKFVFTVLVPDVIRHTEKQDMEQVRDHYDRGDDFYEWFLGPQMIYTSGMISDPRRKETLEELQDNKMAAVCNKLQLQPSDKVLDIGCGWGTLTAFAAKNFGCDVTGVTLAKNQTKFGNERIAKAGLSSDKARVLCMDYRDIPVEKGYYNKIVSLEMAEHVGIRHYSKFLADIHERLDDDGTFLLQVAGLRPTWQYWDLIWGLFMNKYIFRGADASCAIGWVINKLEAAGFEVQSADVLGVHYSATILRWYENWKSNEAKIKAKYGEKLWRIWLYFLASSVIIAREGGSSVFQITSKKNLNATDRVSFWEGRIQPSKYQSVYTPAQY
ncbi:sphingolipid c9-methyltransferase [Ceraceosorus bombacis]|uniref:sphingolipid C(9)-methyltransferase n=1 Tax=Ceraceosorus bombacis TaxID=401625 RepID=A0A0P1BJH4_9BASI|nr:sphingolipid c9-methyltransferase [Ceraceosorus bombacis]